MLERVSGMVIATHEKTVTVMVQGFGVQILVPDSLAVITGREQLFYTWMHWSQEKGPQLLGFLDEISRQVFCLLITCQKIGPGIALAILRQRDARTVVHDIMTSNHAGLSSCQGIGAKKAEQIIYELKDKVGELASSLPFQGSALLADLQHLQAALTSLSYSKQEIADATAHVAHLCKQGTQPELNVLLRKALAYLSASKG